MAGGTSAGDWCLIESDPGVFTELIKGFGVKGVQVEELWTLEPESFEKLKPVHGLIFLFKWFPGDEPSGSIVQDNRLDKIFFAKQMKGLTLSNSDVIKQVHNSFSRQQMFEFDSKHTNKDDDVFHFIGYVPIDGRLYELDGLKDGPIDLGPIPTSTDWLDVVRPVIEKRIQKYNEGEIHFNLMAIISDRKMIYQRKLEDLTSQLESGGMETDELQQEINKIHDMIADEESKMNKYKTENTRRKHNYLPLIMELLITLAKEGKLVPLVEKAKEKSFEKKENEKDKGRCVHTERGL
ncbi:ubiquitin carboxy-terminal hydrolase L5 isoform X5 [Tachypleus tridentatus]|uniref:ubiquitin carboxy-terminal hydrolase L5 isoform X5 n=1 Tax=Tachypleus tridentatus TaxID=6853 RepID=UPI003FCF16D4